MEDADIELCSESKLEKVHAWRICPVGTHYVKEHRVHVRWLFRKRVTASSKLGRPATWEEVVIDYKGYWKDIQDDKIPEALKKLRDYYQRLQQG